MRALGLQSLGCSLGVQSVFLYLWGLGVSGFCTGLGSRALRACWVQGSRTLSPKLRVVLVFGVSFVGGGGVRAD